MLDKHEHMALIELAYQEPERAARLAADPQTPPAVLDVLGPLGVEGVAAAVARNPSTRPGTLLGLLPRFPAAVAENPVLPLLLLEQPRWLDGLSEDGALGLIAREEVPPALLALLAAHGSRRVLEALAASPRAPPELLEGLASSAEEGLQAAVAGNPAAPERALLHLARAGTPLLRLLLARSPGAPAAALALLAEDAFPQARDSARARLAPARPAGRRLALRAAGATDVGVVRSHNEDGYLIEAWPGGGLFQVLDGMGGQSTGSVATEAAMRGARARLGRRLPGQPPRVLFEEVLGECHAELDRLLTRQRYGGLGATLAALFVDAGAAWVGHVGDCRAYRLRGGELTPLTRDHSLLNLLLDEGQLTPEQAPTFPHRNVVVRSLGHGRTTSLADVAEVAIEPGDLYLLCSDGVTGELDDAAIASVLAARRGDPEACVAELIGAAKRAGGRDNLAVVVVEVA